MGISRYPAFPAPSPRISRAIRNKARTQSAPREGVFMSDGHAVATPIGNIRGLRNWRGTEDLWRARRRSHFLRFQRLTEMGQEVRSIFPPPGALEGERPSFR